MKDCLSIAQCMVYTVYHYLILELCDDVKYSSAIFALCSCCLNMVSWIYSEPYHHEILWGVTVT